MNSISILHTLLTCLEFFNSELALASSPGSFWNLCVGAEIWISIVIYGLTAVAGQASIAPPPPPPIQLHQKKTLSSSWQLPAAQELSYYLSTPYPLTMSPLLNKLIS